MTNWGKKRPYKVTRVRTDINPVTCTFMADGKKVSVLNYYKEKYNITLYKN